MGLFSSSKIDLPPVPEFYQNPYVMPSINFGLNRGMDFATLQNLPPELQEAISRDPAISKMAIEAATAQLQPSLRKSKQDTINQLEANNQLTGSTTASALGNIETDFLSQITGIGLNAAIQDVNRALQNRVSLSQTGFNAVANAGNQALTDQSQHNQFNLSNYENQVAKTLAGQESQTGGWIGALTGGLGGALAGFSMGGPVGAAIGGIGGGLAGGLGPQGTGGGVLTAGAGLGGARLSTPKPITSSSAGITNVKTGETLNNTLQQKYPFLVGPGINNMFPMGLN